MNVSSRLPSIDNGKHACQHVFSALFVLLVLAGVSPPASQKPKITRKYITGRCKAVLPEQKCVQARKVTLRILAVLSRDFTQYGRISARQNRVSLCQSMVCTRIKYGRRIPPPVKVNIQAQPALAAPAASSSGTYTLLMSAPTPLSFSTIFSYPRSM